MTGIFYYSPTFFPYAGLAASLHVGWLPRVRYPGAAELWALPFWSIRDWGKGKVFYFGADRRGNEVFAFWNRGHGEMVGRFFQTFLSAFHVDNQQYLLVNVPAGDSLLLLAGWLFSGRPLIGGVAGRLFVKKIHELYPLLEKTVHPYLD